MIMTYKDCIDKYRTDYQLKKALERNEVFQLEAGIYSNDKYASRFEIISVKYPKAIFTMNSAFYYYDLTDSIPKADYLATSRGARKITDSGIKQIYENSNCFGLGKTTVKNNGAIINIYNKERMLVELLRHKNSMPFDYYKEIIENFRLLISNGELDLPLIQDYVFSLPKQNMIMKALQLEVL